MKYYEFGASLMAYGIVSIVAYLLFLLWAVIDEDKSGEPQRPFEAFGQGAEELAAAMGAAFSVQMFFIPILKKNKNPKSYGKYVTVAYILGSIGYFYIAFVGSYSRSFPTQAYSTVPFSSPRALKRPSRATLATATGKSKSSRSSISYTSTPSSQSSSSSASTHSSTQKAPVRSA